MKRSAGCKRSNDSCFCLVTFVSPSKTADPIEMPFGVMTHLGPRKHIIDGVKVRKIHSPPRLVTRRRCRLLSKFFDYLLLFLLLIIICNSVAVLLDRPVVCLARYALHWGNGAVHLPVFVTLFNDLVISLYLLQMKTRN